jgi:hypothetical protein
MPHCSGSDVEDLFCRNSDHQACRPKESATPEPRGDSEKPAELPRCDDLHRRIDPATGWQEDSLLRVTALPSFCPPLI